ncbi:MAG TPA: SDR family oxidoreductase, partial [Ilumatobacteraceae bacterium]
LHSDLDGHDARDDEGVPIMSRITQHDRQGHDNVAVGTSVALVTGGGRGIGRIVAEALAGSGVAVGVIARSSTELRETVGTIEARGGTVAAATADVTRPADLANAIAGLRRDLGPFDLLVNNAGVVGPIGPLWEVDASEWWNAIDVNLRGILLTSRLVLPEMVSRRRGRIINLSSQAGVHRWPLVSAYSVSKAAVTKLTENLAHETARHGVGVFSVHPGLLPIGMSNSVTEGSATNPYEENIFEWTTTELLEGRGAAPAEAVELILRLANGDGDALSGRHISVHDNFDELVARHTEIQFRDLYVLRPEHLTDRRKEARP